MIGKTISHYIIREKLGEGGMGVVYKAEDTRLKRTVALKFLSPQALGGEEEKVRFVHEAQAAASLSHSSICTVHEIDEFEGHSFIAMEYVEGLSLKDRIESGPLKLEEAVNLTIQIAEGLQEAHEKGIVHRDIKPANVMITGKGQVKIMDFGLAKSAKGAALTQAGTTLGTIAYMSPEQTRGDEADARTDIWSSGAVLYEMVTGQRPFKGDYEQAVVYSILNAAPEPVTAIRTGVPMELESIVDRCLEKDTSVRYQTAADLIADLRRLQRSMAGVVTESREAGPTAEPAGRSRRWPLVIGAVVLAAIAVVIFRPYFAPVEKKRDSDRKMLVVLPFENVGTPEDEYFADGITDAITARLAGIHGLGVISRQSAVQYKDTDKNMRQIGDELGVDYVLEGTIQRERPGDPTSRVRVIPQLVNVSDDTHIWAATYDEEMTEVFRVQSDIAERVATELDIRLLEPERKALVAKPTDNLEAYELYLRGIDYLGRRTSRTTAVQALKVFEEAVEMDPGFAEGWAGLSRAHTSLIWVEEGDPDELSKAKAAAEKAVRLGPDLPETHIALGYFYYYGTMEYDKALEHFAAALKLRPGDAEASTAMGLILRRMGRWEEALRYFRDAIRVDPRNYVLNFDGLGLTNLFLHRYPEAERYLNRGISLAPEIANAHMIKSWFHLCWDGDVEAADQVWRQAIDQVDPGEYETIYSSGNGDVVVRLLPETASRILDKIGSRELDGQRDTATGYFYLAKAELSLIRGQSELATSYFDSARVILEPIFWKEEDVLPPAAELSARIALGQAYAGLGLKEEALREGQAALELLPVSKDALGGPLVLSVMAEINTRVGEYDAAIDQLETLLSIPSTMSVHLLRLDPIWDPLRDDPRFQRLLKEYAETGS